MRVLFILAIVSTVMSCSKNDKKVDSFLDCDELAEHYKMYDGENIVCEFYFTLTEYEGEEYIELNSHCADLTRSVVINENCIDICENDPYDPDSTCGKYLTGRVLKEILLIEQ